MPRSGWRIIIAVAGLALLGSPQHQPAYAQERPGDGQTAVENQAQNSEALNLQNSINRLARAIEAEKSNANAEREDQRAVRDLVAQEGMRFWAAVSAIVAAAMALLTAIGVILIWRTLTHTRRAADFAGDMAEEARSATEAAMDAASAASRQTALSEQTTAHQLRAYVGVESISLAISNPNMKTTSHKVTVVLKNFGQTPARVNTFLWLTTDENARTFEVPDHVPPRQYLAPGATTTTVQSHVVEVSEGWELRSGRQRLTVVLRFDYEDIYGAEHGHHISWKSAGANYRESRLERDDEKRTTHRETTTNEG